MIHGDETREKIESYGFLQPFKQSRQYDPNHEAQGGSHSSLSEDQFKLPPTQHFERMRSLANDIFLGLGFSIQGETKNVFFKMVDKFQRNEGGYFSDPNLTKALKEHASTANFHHTLINCLSENILNGVLPDNIESLSSAYMSDKEKGADLPKFDADPRSGDLFTGTVLTVHDIWSMLNR
ncbi:DUF3289 family protein [Photobacterium kishitanii]|uniref:DUF3289 family protein n=1 Tax=Photobacterium kishitanii TaxID=318456 RepID=UPI003AFB5E75